ncbi:hypothetical protein AAZX31_05G030100 [Glycine max]|uniref:Uncharacterized protein n=1 Tax=Glycine max TaxID=3847 RepID=A0A0R0JXR6_SOYBN
MKDPHLALVVMSIDLPLILACMEGKTSLCFPSWPSTHLKYLVEESVGKTETLPSRYFYTDLYADEIWAGIEEPENSGNFTTSKMHYSCAHDSPIQCDSVPESSLPALGYIYSFGEDNNKDVYILASTGVYRVARPSHCSYTCSLAKKKATTTTPSHASCCWSYFSGYLFLHISSLLLLLIGFM